MHLDKLRAALARVGIDALSARFDAGTIDLLQLLDLRAMQSWNLADLLLSQIGELEVLRDKALRARVIEGLPKSAANELCRLLGIESTQDPWTSLERTSFHRSSISWERLKEFFDVTEPTRKVSGPAASRTPTPGYALFDHQRNAVSRVNDLLQRTERRRVLLHMPTGAGKTRTTMSAICHAMVQDGDRHVVLWLAYSEELCDQACSEFAKAWSYLGDKSISMHRHYGPYRTSLDTVKSGFMVASLSLMYQQSLSSQSDILAIARRISMVVMDEAHQAIAPTYRHLIELLAIDPKTAVLGLSATPGRSWLDAGEDIKLADFFDHNKVALEVEGFSNPVGYLQAEGYLAEVEYVSIPYDPGPEWYSEPEMAEEIASAVDIPQDVLYSLSNDAQRNLLIASHIMREADEGGKIIVFACSVSHARLLADVLRMKQYRAASITAETDKEQRRSIIEAYRGRAEIDILVNYGVLTTGFDAPKTNVAIISRPTKSVVLYSQMVGRAARGPKAGGNSSCRILTVVDRIPGFRNIAESFGYWDDIW